MTKNRGKMAVKMSHAVVQRNTPGKRFFISTTRDAQGGNDAKQQEAGESYFCIRWQAALTLDSSQRALRCGAAHSFPSDRNPDIASRTAWL